MCGSNNLSDDLSVQTNPKYKGKKIRVTNEIQFKIKKILGLAADSPFPRCRGQYNKCKRTAGLGSRGDFYGLGDDVGHFGVGLCYVHEKWKSKEMALKIARQHMEALQAFGLHNTDGKCFERLAEVKAVEVEKYREIEQGRDLVINALKDFERKIKNNDFKEYVSGGKDGAMLVEASDKTIAEMACKIGTTLSKIAKDQHDISSDNYIHESEVTMRIPRMMTSTKRLFVKLKELMINKKDGNRDPIEEISEEYLTIMKDVWKDIKTGDKN